jgi:Domain of unknown function (DUF4336)
MLRKIANNLWVQDDAMKMMGMSLDLRMTVAKLSSGELWIHSPTPLSPELTKQIDLVGKVAYIVGPSNGHNLWLIPWQEAYPKAQVLVSAGIPKKLPNLRDPQILAPQSCATLWAGDISHLAIEGVPFFDENVFFHEPSKSLIVTDLIQDHRNKIPSTLTGKFLQTVIFGALLGFRGLTLAPPLKVPGVIKDRKKFKESLQQLLAWDFERVVITHGPVLEMDAKARTTALMSHLVG